jgi:hypothetical protein
MLNRSGHLVAPEEFRRDRVVLHVLGIALEDAARFLPSASTYEQFEAWVIEQNGGAIDPERLSIVNAIVSGTEYDEKWRSHLRSIDAMDPVLNSTDIDFWRANGFVVLHDAVSVEAWRAAADVVWSSIAASPEDPDTWYGHQNRQGIMVQVFRHPALEANRRSTRIHKAFAQVWGTSDLIVTTDRCGFNPPERPGFQFPGPRLHWDLDLSRRPLAVGVQGILYLADTAAEQGAFTCVPGFHTRLESWLDSGPADPQQQAARWDGTPIAGRAGDLILWDQRLPHGSRPNRASKPRIVQYIEMYPPR